MIGVVRSKRSFAILLAIALLFVAVLPAAVQAAEAGKAVEVRVKVGSGQMTVNGEKVKIQAPYNSGKVAMVPLSVFTNAKGFAATLKPSGKSIQLTHLKHKLVLTKGSKSATFDGKKATLPVAPVDKSSVTMVPLEAIAKALGFKVSTDAKTKELVIKGTSATQAASGSGIDSDAGKNKVGDSHYKWSMNLPTNLAQDEQWSKGSRITFGDVKGEFYMAVFVDEASDPLDAEEQRELLKIGVYGRTLVDVSSVKIGSDTFQRLIMKDGNGFFYEYRGIQRNGYFYTVIFGKKAKAKSELDTYKSLLDSFQTSFDAKNKALKDLSIVKNGKISYKDAYLGVQLKLPIAWDDYSSYGGLTDADLTYEGPNEESLTISVHSILPNDTVEAWAARDIQYFEQMVLEQYRKPVDTKDITWNGVASKQLTLTLSPDTTTWVDAVSVYAIKGNYKYDVTLTYPQEHKAKAADVLNEILRGMRIDFATVERNLGQVPDEDDARDVNALVTKTSKAYGYSVTLPKHWITSPLNMENGMIILEVDEAIMFMIMVEEDADTQELEDAIDEMYSELSDDVKQESKTKVQIGGVEATRMRYVATDTSEGDATLDVYLFEKNGNAFMVQAALNGPFATPLNTKQLEDAVNSISFN